MTRTRACTQAHVLVVRAQARACSFLHARFITINRRMARRHKLHSQEERTACRRLPREISAATAGVCAIAAVPTAAVHATAVHAGTTVAAWASPLPPCASRPLHTPLAPPPLPLSRCTPLALPLCTPLALLLFCCCVWHCNCCSHRHEGQQRVLIGPRGGWRAQNQPCTSAHSLTRELANLSVLFFFRRQWSVRMRRVLRHLGISASFSKKIVEQVL